MKRTRKLPKPKAPVIEVYAILWTDAVLSGEDQANPYSPIPAVTFGIITKVDQTQLQVAGELFADGETRLRTAIPKGMGVKAVKIGSFKVPQQFLKWRLENEDA